MNRHPDPARRKGKTGVYFESIKEILERCVCPRDSSPSAQNDRERHPKRKRPVLCSSTATEDGRIPSLNPTSLGIPRGVYPANSGARND